MTAEIPCVLIGGTGRSGTNILKEIFCTHPLVLGFPFETRFTVDPDGLAPTLRMLRSSCSPFVGECALRRLNRLLDRLAKRTAVDKFASIAERLFGADSAHRRYRDWQLQEVFPNFTKNKEELIRDLTLLTYFGVWVGAPTGSERGRRIIAHDDGSEVSTTAMRKFLRSIYAGALAKANRQVYVDDNTYNVLYAEELLDLLPNARLIHVVRDPRDVIASYIRQRWTPSSVTAAIAFYTHVIECWLLHRKALDSNRFIEIRLEDLCNEPEVVLKHIFEWAGIPFDTQVLDVALTKSNTGRWRREFTSAEQSELDKKLRPFLDLYDYKG